MPRFQYKAVSISGENVSGEYSAPDQNSVVSMLRSGGYYPLNIRQVADDVDRATKKKVKIKPLAGLCQQMYAMLRSGVPVAKTLDILREQTEDDTLRKILNDVYIKIQRGNSLYDSFIPYKNNFPMIFLNMIEAGEESGMLDMCMHRAGLVFTRSAKLGGKLRAAMVYPTLLTSLMFGIVILLMVFVIPNFVKLFEENEAALPFLTQALVNISNFMVARWYVILLVLAVAVICIVMWLTSDKGRLDFDRFKLRIPVVKKLLLKVYASRYARTLSSLNAAGVSLPTALSVTARSIGNRYLEDGLYKVMEDINHGKELSVLLERMGTMPPMIVYLTRLGEESGTMDELLSQAADFYDDEADAALQALTALMEPAMIILMAIIVLPILLAILLPVFNMYQVIT